MVCVGKVQDLLWNSGIFGEAVPDGKTTTGAEEQTEQRVRMPTVLIFWGFEFECSVRSSSTMISV